MRAVLLRINEKYVAREKIVMAAKAVRRGSLVVFPTETVYGIGSNALSEEACLRIFAAKGRHKKNPLIVHVNNMQMADAVAHIPAEYRGILKKIWPAPLTVVAKSRGIVAMCATAGLDTVAVRMPMHKVALALIGASGVPIAAPSANLSGRPSATDAAHAAQYFGNAADFIIDSGETRFGLESTVLDLRTFTILRPGAFTPEDILHWFGKRPSTASKSSSAGARSPGMLFRHYSPRTQLFLFAGRPALLPRIIRSDKKLAFIGSDETSLLLKASGVRTLALGSRHNPIELARNLFKALIEVDSLHADFAIAESFPEKGIGIAIMDRLRRASENRVFSNSKGLHTLMSRASLRAGHGRSAPSVR